VRNLTRAQILSRRISPAPPPTRSSTPPVVRTQRRTQDGKKRDPSHDCGHATSPSGKSRRSDAPFCGVDGICLFAASVRGRSAVS
jgi:hypothetical protein